MFFSSTLLFKRSFFKPYRHLDQKKNHESLHQIKHKYTRIMKKIHEVRRGADVRAES